MKIHEVYTYMYFSLCILCLNKKGFSLCYETFPDDSFAHQKYPVPGVRTFAYAINPG